jgi:hypothetical protein
MDYLGRLQRSVRLIVVGRSPVAEGRNVEVGDLDGEAAAGYLQARVPDLSPGEITQVLERVGRNPLARRLAAELLTNRAVDRTTALLSLRHGQIQGLLYERILDHIEDERVRKIAHPGLLVGGPMPTRSPGGPVLSVVPLTVAARGERGSSSGQRMRHSGRNPWMKPLRPPVEAMRYWTGG